jgi:hypothetical protein
MNKHFFSFVLLSVFVISCTQQQQEPTNPIKGVWKMVGGIKYENNKPVDTLSWDAFGLSEGFQTKIFTDQFMMFVGNNIQKDSVTGEDINYGQAGFANRYSFENGILTEYNVDGTDNFQGWKKEAPNKDDQGRWIATFKIDIGPNYYSQYPADYDGGDGWAEYYIRVE